MRRSLAAVLLGLLLWSLLPALAAASGNPPSLTGRAAILIDAETGQVLFAQRADDRNFPASTTKLLTALVAVEASDLTELVTVSSRASGAEGSSCYLRIGEKQPLGDLLRCMLVASGNDAAIAVAEHVAGTEQAFGRLMTARAHAAGAVHSHFTNASGLHHQNHYTTARDLALVAREAVANPVVRELAGALKVTLGGVEERELFNANRLLLTYDAAVAAKTGFTQQARHTLVAYGERGEVKLVGVILGYENRNQMFDRMADLLEWGFDQYASRRLVSVGQAFGSVPVARGEEAMVAVVAGDSLSRLLPAGTSTADLTFETQVAEGITAPVARGLRVGEVIVRFGEAELGRVPLVTVTTVDVQGSRLEEWASSVLNTAAPFMIRLMAGAAGTGLLLVLLRLGLALRRRKRFRGGQIVRYSSRRYM